MRSPYLRLRDFFDKSQKIFGV